MIKRFLDLFLCVVCVMIFTIPAIVIFIAIKLSSTGPAIFWSPRVGRFNQMFLMPKFRSMRVDAPLVATDMLHNPDTYITDVGRFLRSTSLDELPQLWSILVGQMSFVGPRPALISQRELIDARSELGIDSLLPGLTGWAQVNGRDEISLINKINFDEEYLKKKSFFFDLKILLLTIKKVVIKDGVSH